MFELLLKYAVQALKEARDTMQKLEEENGKLKEKNQQLTEELEKTYRLWNTINSKFPPRKVL
jgi:FtsZ-binding cell division protein ZapB